MSRIAHLNQVLNNGLAEINAYDRRELFSLTAQHPLSTALFGIDVDWDTLLTLRWSAWKLLQGTLSQTVDLSPLGLWCYPLGLAQFLLLGTAKVVGIAGPPGVGKTTLAQVTSASLRAFRPTISTLALSLDDFYYSKSERRRRGIKFRAESGSHNIPAAVALLSAVHKSEPILQIPRFDHAADDVLPPLPAEGCPNLVLFDGWLLGSAEQEYRELSRLLDYLIYLNCPIALARSRRFRRESAIRLDSQGQSGFSAARMRRFWAEVLEPGIKSWVEPIKDLADLVITFDVDGELVSATNRASIRER